MNFLVALVGWVLVATGLLDITQPHLMLSWVLGWPGDVRFYVTVGTRVLLGLLFIFAATKCRLPRFIRTIGIIALVAGVVYFFLGRGRLDLLIQWTFGQPTMFIQLLYAVTILFGVALIYSGSRRRS
jgi:ribose/xylose/arabinose/galactoside ABC-type transport system permease subunit